MRRGRPFVRLKSGASLDGRTALANGAEQVDHQRGGARRRAALARAQRRGAHQRGHRAGRRSAARRAHRDAAPAACAWCSTGAGRCAGTRASSRRRARCCCSPRRGPSATRAAAEERLGAARIETRPRGARAPRSEAGVRAAGRARDQRRAGGGRAALRRRAVRRRAGGRMAAVPRAQIVRRGRETPGGLAATQEDWRPRRQFEILESRSVGSRPAAAAAAAQRKGTACSPASCRKSARFAALEPRQRRRRRGRAPGDRISRASSASGSRWAPASAWTACASPSRSSMPTVLPPTSRARRCASRRWATSAPARA